MWGKDQGLCFSIRYSVVSESFVEKTFFPPPHPWIGLGPLLKVNWHICVGQYLYSLLCSIDPCIYPYINITIFFYYCSFIASLEIRKSESSNFGIFKIVLAITGPMHFLINFQINLPFSTKNIAEILISILLDF